MGSLRSMSALLVIAHLSFAQSVSFTTPARTVSSSQCSAPLTVNVTPSSASARLLGVDAGGLGVSFFRDPSCGTPLSQLSLAAGQTSASFYVLGGDAGTGHVQVSLGAARATQPCTVAPALLQLSSAALVAGVCKGPNPLSLIDDAGTPIVTTVAVPVSVSRDSNSLTIHTSGSCTGTSVSSVTIPAGQSSVNLWYRSTIARTTTVTAAAPAVSDSVVTIDTDAGAFARLVGSPPSSPNFVGSCVPWVIEFADAFGNLTAPSSSVRLDLGADAVTNFWSNASCSGPALSFVQVPAGAPSTSLFFRSTNAHPDTLYVSTSAATSLSYPVTYLPLRPVKLSVGTTPFRGEVGQCLTVHVRAHDHFGNQAPLPNAVPVAMTAPSPWTYFVTSDCSGPPTTTAAFAADASVALVYGKTSRARVYTLGAVGGGLDAGSLDLEVLPTAPTQLLLETPSTIAAGGCTQAAVSAYDGYGNRVVLANVPVTLRGSNLAAYASPSCVSPLGQVVLSATAPRQDLYLRSTVAGTAALSVEAPGLMSADAGVQVLAGPLAQLELSAPVAPLVAGDCTPALVLGRDEFGNLAAFNGLRLDVSTDGGDLRAYDDGPCQTPATELTPPWSFFLSATRLEPGVVSVTASPTVLVKRSVQVVAGPPSMLRLESTVAAAEVDACAGPVTLSVRDRVNHAVSPTSAIAATLAADSPTLRLWADAACSTPLGPLTLEPSAASRAFFVSDSRVGFVTLRASAGSWADATLGLSFGGAPAPIDAGQSTDGGPDGGQRDAGSLESPDAGGSAPDAGGPGTPEARGCGCSSQAAAATLLWGLIVMRRRGRGLVKAHREVEGHPGKRDGQRT